MEITGVHSPTRRSLGNSAENTYNTHGGILNQYLSPTPETPHAQENHTALTATFLTVTIPQTTSYDLLLSMNNSLKPPSPPLLLPNPLPPLPKHPTYHRESNQAGQSHSQRNPQDQLVVISSGPRRLVLRLGFQLRFRRR